MTNPVKRPAVTYQRGRKVLAKDLNGPVAMSVAINPNLALQQKINDLIFSKEDDKDPIALESEEFDSAYHETNGNAKKVHDLVQVGETRRFIDEIDYLLDGLSTTNSLQIIRDSLQELVEKSLVRPSAGDFGLKLKSHGALSTIFESLSEMATQDPTVQEHLIALITGLLYDVRRLDFFFKTDLLVLVVKYCLDYTEEMMDSGATCEIILKKTALFTNLNTENTTPWTEKHIYNYIGIWLLSKWMSFSTSNNDIIFSHKTINKIIGFFKDPSIRPEIKDKAAILLDCLLNSSNTINSTSTLEKIDLTGLLEELILNDDKDIDDLSLNDMKLAVSITGSPVGMDYLMREPRTRPFCLVRKLIKISFSRRSGQVRVLTLSCLINLLDRCDESVIDEFRYLKAEDKDDTIIATNSSSSSSSSSLLQFISQEYFSYEDETEFGSLCKSLHTLLLGFLCRLNRTNLAVIKGSASERAPFLLSEMTKSVSNFISQADEKDYVLRARLNEILTTIIN